jgi:hypothetical protein
MDLELKETGNGGDFIKKSKDLSVIEGFENMIYLALFGGNVKASTKINRQPTEQIFSFWGNELESDLGLQFNSETERILNTVALDSSGRRRIEQSVNKDLEFMLDFAILTVDVLIIDTDKVQININVNRPQNLQQQQFVYIWDVTNKELIDREFANANKIIRQAGSTKIFDNTFDVSFE